MLNAKDTIACVLRLLQKKGVPSSKIFLHKFLYFLDTQGIRAGLRFEPWTYGPFSFDLAKNLNEMIFWDEIEEYKPNEFKIINIENYGTPGSELEQEVEQLLVKFQNAVGPFTFDNLECLGTVIYCIETLLFQGKSATEENVVNEFIAWKGHKYPRERIIQTYENYKKIQQ